MVLAGGTVTIHTDLLKQVKLFAVGTDGNFESTVSIAILALVMLSGLGPGSWGCHGGFWALASRLGASWTL